MSYMIGMPTFIDLKNIEENILLCKMLNLKFLELNMNLPYCFPQNNNISELLRIKDKNNISLTMHFPEEIDFGTLYPSIREANISLFENLANWGYKIGIEKITLHLNPGPYFSLPKEKVWIYEKNKPEFVDNLINSVNSLKSIAKNYNIKICIENTTVPYFMEEIFYHLSQIDDIFFTWDIGHDAKSGYKMEKIYTDLQDKVMHIHMHDYDGNRDHLVLFDGIIDLSNKLEFIKKNNLSTVIEVKTVDALKESLKRLKDKDFI